MANKHNTAHQNVNNCKRQAESSATAVPKGKHINKQQGSEVVFPRGRATWSFKACDGSVAKKDR